MSQSYDFAKMLTEKFKNEENHSGFAEMEVREGRKYDKIVVIRDYQGVRRADRVFAFVERATGDLYKAASWKTPAKHKRYNGNELLNMAVDDADIHGSFLYIR